MNIWNRFSKRLTQLALFVAILSLAGGAFAQGRVSKYIVSVPPSGYSDISGTKGATLVLSGAPILHYYNSTAAGSLPFSFNYDNQTISAGTTLCWVGGCMGFGSYGTYPSTLSNASYPNQICFQNGYWCWGDRGQTGYLYTLLTGTAPNRVFTIQINNYHGRCGGYSRGYGSSYTGSVQIKLYETTNVIDLLYSNHSNSASPCGSTYSFSVGLNGSSSGGFDYVSLEGNTGNFPSKDWRLTPPAPPSNFSLQSKNLNYSGVMVGSSVTLSTTLTVLGPSPLIVNSATMSGSSDFQLLNPLSPGTTIAYPGSYTFNIKYTPTITGNTNATLTVVTNAKDSATQSAFLNGSGLAPLVQYSFAPYLGINYPYNSMFHHVALHFGDTVKQYMYVKNTGQVPLTFNSISTYGLQANMYNVFYRPQNPLPAGATDSIGISFTPFLEGRPDAALAISTNAYNQPNDTVSLWGTGKLAHLVVTPQSGRIATGTINGSLVFDSVAIGDSVCQTLALHNTGTDTLYINRQQVTYGDYDFHFYPLTKPDTMLAPDQTKLVNVCFVPVQAGARFASVRFYTNIPKTYPDNRDTSQFFVQVSGTGVPYGKLAVSGPLNVSSLVSVQKCVEDTIWNTGSADLTINSIKLSGANAAMFTLTPPTLPLIIPKGTYTTVQLCFTPTARGLSTATLDVVGSTSGRTQNMTLAINGTGQIGCMDATPNPVAFGSTALPSMTMAKSGQDTSKVTVKNCGDVPMTFTATSSDAHYTILSTLPTAAVAPNGTTTLDVQFSPDTIGAVNGNVTITPSEGSVTAQTIAMGGVGAGVYITPSGTPAATPVGQSSTFTVTLVNNGNIAWTPNAPTVTGDYAAGAVTPAQIAPGGSGTLTVTFTPAQTGARAGTLSFAGPDVTPLGSTLPYTFSANGTSGAGVAMKSTQDGFAIGASYPNPATSSASVIVTMPREATVAVSIVRLDGSQVASVYSGSLSEGQHVLNLDVTDLASGTYFYMFESGTVRLARQIVVTK